MDDKKKIVLGSEDFLAKGNDDIFININLQQTFNQIKKDRYDNNFDLSKQFRKERNESRNFRVYGIVESNVIDTDNISLYIYKDSELTQSVGVVVTTPLVYSEENVFSKKRGKFLLELDFYDAESVFIQIRGDNLSFADQVIEQRLVYYTLDGDFVEYGTETVDIGLFNTGSLTIENNFPFFYNKHWIKKDLEIVETKQAIVQFATGFSSVPEGQSVEVDIVLDKTSPFGNEIVTLDAILGTASLADYSLSVSGSPVSFPFTLNWNQGEKDKKITFDALTDPVIEFSENINFNLSNLQFVKSGITIEHSVTIEDTTPRRITNYHFGEIYKNRLEFSGRSAQNGTNIPRKSGFAILRNGLKFKNKQEAFYPVDKHSIIVTNEGIDTILPINASFGINSESLWPAFTEKTFTFDIDYDGDEKHKVKIVYPPDMSSDSNSSNYGYIRINGVKIVPNTSYLWSSYIESALLDGPDNYITSKGYEKDWVAEAAPSGVTITSLTTGLPVIVEVVATNLASYGGGVPNPDFTPYVEEIDPFVERKQIPKVLKLFANDNNNNSTRYSFNISKNGYSGTGILAASEPASEDGVDRYLITSIDNVCRNWNGSKWPQNSATLGDDCIYSKDAMPEVGSSIITQVPTDPPYPYLAPGLNSSQNNYFWPVGIANINGTVLILSFAGINSSRNLLTNFISAKFYPDPLLINPCTNSILAVNDVAQKVKITIPLFDTGNGSTSDLYAENADSFRSFDYRTGETGPYNTVYNEQVDFSNSPLLFFSWNGAASVSGAANASSTLGSILEYGYPNSNYPNNTPALVPSGPFFGLDISDEHNLLASESDSSFYLESKIPGVPFDITNIKDAFVHTSASNIYGNNVVAGDYTAPGGPITVELITPNALAGVGENVANNWMGGYNVDFVFNTGTSPLATTVPAPPSSFTL